MNASRNKEITLRTICLNMQYHGAWDAPYRSGKSLVQALTIQPGHRREKLKGERAEQYSIRINIS